jgi:hypothetical protein
MSWHSKSNPHRVQEKAHQASDENGLADKKRSARKVNRIEFHPVNTSVYDGRWSIPSTYEVYRYPIQCKRLLTEVSRI